MQAQPTVNIPLWFGVWTTPARPRSHSKIEASHAKLVLGAKRTLGIPMPAAGRVSHQKPLGSVDITACLVKCQQSLISTSRALTSSSRKRVKMVSQIVFDVPAAQMRLYQTWLLNSACSRRARDDDVRYHALCISIRVAGASEEKYQIPTLRAARCGRQGRVPSL